MGRNYSYSARYSESVYTTLNKVREAHSQAMDKLEVAEKRIALLTASLAHLWEVGDMCNSRECELCQLAAKTFKERKL